MVPTSAHTGDGMGSLIATLIERCQTGLAKRLSYTDELQATVMEVSSFLITSLYIKVERKRVFNTYCNTNLC